MRMGEKGSRHVALVLLLLLVLAVPQEAFANSAGKTGRSDSGCGGTACHSNTGTVTPDLSGLPGSGYSAGAVYTLTMGGSGGPSGTNGGFNLDASHGAFSNPGSNAQIQNGEVTHSNSNSRSWTVDWTAPSSGSGDVTFYLAVNFVNGNGLNTGDAWGYSSWTSSQAAASTNSSLNQAGSERGSVFSNSVFELNSGSPTLVLDNGTRVTFASVNTNTSNSSSSVYTSDDVVSIAGSCAILDNYSLRCTGINNYGQLGLGSFSLSNGTVDLGNRMAAAISDGNSHNCAILDDGSVSCWGRNNVGQLGDGSNANRNAPVSVDLGTNTTAVAISAGSDYTCAITNTGAVKCWGFNGYGVLADGTTTNSNVPVEVNHSTGMRAVAIATPGYGACAIFENDSVYCWGQSYTVTAINGPVTNGSVQIDFAVGRTAVSIDGTSDHMCAILDNGSMNCWGVNTYGQWGDGSCSSVIPSSGCDGENGNTPVHVNLSTGSSAIAISTGAGSTCAILDNYSLQCWGQQSGEFDGTSDNILLPHTMNFTDGADIAYSDQDMDGDGTRNALDTHMAGDDDGDGVPVPDDPYPSNPARWMNCDPGSWGRLTCTEAEPGHFAATGDLYHQPCQTGTYQPESGYPLCYSASAGNYASFAQATAQTLCSAGTYQPNVGQTSCIDSSPGNYTNPNFGDAGSYSSSAFNISANSAEYNGSIDSNSDVQDLFMMSVPKDAGVTVGLTSPSGADFDLAIYDYNLALLNSSYSTAYDETSTNNTNFSDNSNLYILVAPYNGTGHYTLQVWLFSTLDGAIIGNPSMVVDVEIGAGQYQCSEGTYQPYSNQSSCVDASPGYYVPDNGSISQTPCSSGSYQSMMGQSSCLLASLGNYVDTPAAIDQTPANAGHYVNTTGATEDVACSAGTYQPNTGQTSCLDADAGHYVGVTGALSQTPCSAGTYQPNTGQTSCLDADAGHYVPTTGATNQTACSIGTYQPSIGQVSCLSADPGHYVNAVASTTQTPCDIGSFQPLSGQDKCDLSDPGYYVDSTGSANQTACDPGTFQPNTGSSSCIDSPPGNYVDTTAAIAPTPCVPGTYNPLTGSSSADACLPADPGNSVPSWGSSYQTPCTAGHYQPNNGSSSCLDADAGNYVDSGGATAQTPCGLGTYNPDTAQIACMDASPGYYVDSTGATQQTACRPGSYNPNSGSSSLANCVFTDAGHYTASEGMSSQSGCEEGTYQPSTGQTSCLDADPGHFVPASESTTQAECQLGTFQPEGGTSSCLDAGPGNYVDSNGSASQTPCPPTTYNPATGSDDRDDCVDVDPGHYSDVAGLADQIECAPGTYQPNSGQTTCLDSDPGYFVAYSGMTSQSSCPAGTYNPSSASDSGSDCMASDAGHYVDSQASFEQTPCSPGTYQSAVGQLSCLDAMLGHYAPNEGQAEQLPAPLDTYAVGTGSTSVEDCPESHITLQVGADSEEDCYLDTDGDRTHDAIDSDDDGDGIDDGVDLCPLGLMGWSSSPGSDNDADGCKDADEDADDDNDGFPDDADALPFDSTEWYDNDMDGLGDNEDPDDDNDGLTDSEEDAMGTDPKDTDTDDDGFNDALDAFPNDPREWADSDGDGYGDNDDAFPNDPAKHLEEDLIGKYGFVFAVLGAILVLGLGGTMVMRRKADTTITEAAEHTESVASDSQSMYQTEPEVEETLDSDQFIHDLEAELETPSAPANAKLNEQGQLVWVDDSGTVFAQNPDGSIVTFDAATGTWTPLE